jgi:hypothetical protein
MLRWRGGTGLEKRVRLKGVAEVEFGRDFGDDLGVISVMIWARLEAGHVGGSTDGSPKLPDFAKSPI